MLSPQTVFTEALYAFRLSVKTFHVSQFLKLKLHVLMVIGTVLLIPVTGSPNKC